MFSIDVQKSIFLKPSLVVGLSKMWYNQTEVATKTELENVKGLIDVSAKIVYSTAVPDRVNIVSIPVEYDYVIITSTLYNFNYGEDTSVSTCHQYNITLNKGGTAYIPAAFTDSGLHKHDHGYIIARALAAQIDFDDNIDYSTYLRITIAAYKY